MPRPRQYQNNAQKQAAYRQRHAAQRPPREGYLAALARSLHGELREAVRARQSVLPPELLGSAADETLRNLIGYIRSGQSDQPPSDAGDGAGLQSAEPHAQHTKPKSQRAKPAQRAQSAGGM